MNRRYISEDVYNCEKMLLFSVTRTDSVTLIDRVFTSVIIGQGFYSSRVQIIILVHNIEHFILGLRKFHRRLTTAMT